MGTIICTKCHKEHQDTCKFCDNCGNILTPPTTQTTENISTAKMKYDVIIEKVGSRKLSVISAIRILTDYSLQEAKTIVEGKSKVVMQGVSKETAKKAKDELQKAGAFVNITSYEIYESKPNTAESTNYTNTVENIASAPEAVDSIDSELNIKRSDPVVATVQKQEQSIPEKNKKVDPKPQYHTADKDLVEILKNADREIKSLKIIKIITKILNITTLVISGIIFLVSLLLFGFLNLIISLLQSLLAIATSGGNIAEALSPLAQSLGTFMDPILDSLGIPLIILIIFSLFISIPFNIIHHIIIGLYIKKNGYDKYKTLEVFMDNANRENPFANIAFQFYPFIENTSGKITCIISKIIDLVFAFFTITPIVITIILHNALSVPVEIIISKILSTLDSNFYVYSNFVPTYRTAITFAISIIILVAIFSNLARIKNFIQRKIRNIQLKKWLDQ